MRYVEPLPITKARAEEILAGGNGDEICEAMVALAFYEADWRWTQERCLELTHHADWTLRAIAATCLGHLARIHRTLEMDRVRPRLVELMNDPQTRGYAENAADDIKMFMNVDLRR